MFGLFKRKSKYQKVQDAYAALQTEYNHEWWRIRIEEADKLYNLRLYEVAIEAHPEWFKNDKIINTPEHYTQEQKDLFSYWTENDTEANKYYKMRESRKTVYNMWVNGEIPDDKMNVFVQANKDIGLDPKLIEFLKKKGKTVY